jgi:hypothetical protein
MKCHNCEKPAFFAYDDGKFSLCLDCSSKFEDMLSKRNADLERQVNFAADEMDEIMGMGRMGARYPARPQPTIVQGGTFNHIKVSDSTVGIINTGQLHQVETAISVIGRHGDKQLAETIKTLTQAIIADPGMDPASKKDAVEIMSVLSSEATVPKEQRKTSIAKPLIDRLRELLGDAANIATIAQAALPIIAAAFL